MRVLLLAWDYPPARGGIQIWMLELARRLPDADVLVLAPAVPGSRVFDRQSGVRVRRVPGAGLGPVPWVWRLTLSTVRACLAGRPDLVVCGHVLVAPAALLARALFRVPYAMFAYAYEIRRRHWRTVVGLLLRSADAVLAISKFTRALVLERGVAPERVHILHPGVDPDRFTPDRARTDGSGSAILSVSRLTELYKGHDTVIRALPLIKSRCPAARYVIAGDGRLRQYLARVARSVGVEADVVFAGEVSDDELRCLYRESSVLVQLSRESASGGGAEGFGIVCLEAAACGRPVVAGRSGGLVDAIVDGETGILVDPLDLGATAEAIVSVLTNPALARRLGEAGRRRVVEQFTWDAVTAEARRLLARAAGQTWTPSAKSSS